jgi:hypothetical protein
MPDEKKPSDKELKAELAKALKEAADSVNVSREADRVIRQKIADKKKPRNRKDVK